MQMSENERHESPKQSRRFVRWRRGVFVAGGLAVLLGVMIVGHWFAGKPQGLGVVNGRLAKCPDSPNCVCSQEDRESHRTQPLKFSGDPQAAFSRLVQIIQSQARTKITEQTAIYLRVEFTTPVLRFVDDVEFLLVPDEHVIHVRSASRVGHTDLGVNRNRVEKIRAAFNSTANGPH